MEMLCKECGQMTKPLNNKCEFCGYQIKKDIQIIELGYYHPSNTNWSYHIFMIIDETGARLYKATFGGEHRIKLPEDQLEYLHAGKGTGVAYKWADVKDLPDIESYNGKNR